MRRNNYLFECACSKCLEQADNPDESEPDSCCDDDDDDDAGGDEWVDMSEDDGDDDAEMAGDD